MTSNHKPKCIPIRVERPNLDWIEAKLRESLQPPPQAPSHGCINPQLNAEVIPMGEHCYHPEPMAAGYVPCPYFTHTAYGTTQCAYVHVEAYSYCTLDDDHRLQFRKRFGSRMQAQAAAVIEIADLPDSIKICGLNMLNPITIEHHRAPPGASGCTL